MKKLLYAILAALTACALAVEGFQSLAGYEAGTGLPQWGNLPLLLLLVLGLVWFLAAHRLTARDTPVFPQDFVLTKKQLLLPVAGALLVALSGAGWLAGALLPNTVETISADGIQTSVVPVLSGRLVSSSVPITTTMLVLGAMALLMGLGLLPTVIACLPRDGHGQSFSRALLLTAPVVLVARSVLVYRIHSVDPVLGHYAAEMLAMVTLTLAYYRLSGFGYGTGGSRRFALYAGWAVMLSVAALVDTGFPDALFYLGNALVLSGFLTALPAESNPGTQNRQTI